MYRHWSVLLVSLMVLALMFCVTPTGPAIAALEPFYQGAGYEAGAYDSDAFQPAAFNWSHQARFNGPISPLLKWEAPTGCNQNYDSRSVIGSDGTIYLVPNCVYDSKLLAFSPDGNLKWSFSGIYGEPAIRADGEIYIEYAEKGKMYLAALKPDGTIDWQLEVGSSRSLVIGHGGTVYLTSYNKGLLAINPNGTLKWEWLYNTGANETVSWRTTPVIGSNGTIYVGGVVTNSQTNEVRGMLIAVGTDGNKKWEHSFSSGITPDQGTGHPAIGPDGTVYVGLQKENEWTLCILSAINPDGSEKWQYQSAGAKINGAPAVAPDGTIYFGGARNNSFCLVALDPNGTPKWSVPGTWSCPVIGKNGTIFAICCTSLLKSITPNGVVNWEYELPKMCSGATPSMVDGIIYACSDDGPFYAIGTGTAPPSSDDPLQISSSVNQAYPGAKCKVDFDIFNSASTPSSKDTYLSFYVDTQAEGSGNVIATKKISSIKPDKHKKGKVTLTLPSNLSGDQCYIWAVVIGMDKDEKSNVLTVPLLYPDLEFVSGSLSTAGTLKPGGKISVNESVTNTGGIKSGKTTVTYYLWDGSNPGSKILLGSRKLSSLMPGKTSKKKTNMKLPANSSGNWYMVAVIDQENTVSEWGGEENNQISIPLQIVN
ncbi:MAG: CARDB domain-containing protein [Chitinophagales bacterium]